MSTKLLMRDRPHRAIALVTSTHALVFRQFRSSTATASTTGPNSSTTSLQSTLVSSAVTGNTFTTTATNVNGPRCIVELLPADSSELDEFRTVSYSVYGTLGLITVENDVFLCIVSGISKVATIRPGESIQRILSVDFQCLTKGDYDRMLNEDINPYPTDSVDEEGHEMNPLHQTGRRDQALEHPCLALKKLLSGGTFYFSADFDITRRLQDRAAEEDLDSFDFDSFDKGYLWNSYMIKPLIDFRSRLSAHERHALDSTRMLTSAIRGFALTMSVPASSSPARKDRAGVPSALTLISRLSCRRAGTRFNARGIDDDGQVANFVETETIFWSPTGTCFSYVQIRGSIPIFWEQAAGILPGQQKIQITRSPQATQPAFDKHFEELEVKYGSVHVVNLLSKDKSGEVELSDRYRSHIVRSSLNSREPPTAANTPTSSEHRFLRETEYDFHAETRSGGGYEAASNIRYYIQDSADSFGYHLSEVIDDTVQQTTDTQLAGAHLRRYVTILQQQGIFRTNCLDCLDRTNLVQTNISQMSIEAFLEARNERINADFLARHGSLWADNGDALSRIYAGTGALKSSFTRHGKMSLAGALADARKSATRMYINNFADKDRQNNMDMLLGRLVGQTPVYLFDPINDYVVSELARRSSEYTTTKEISIWAGTFNLNGRTTGINEDLTSWLCPPETLAKTPNPHIVAVGFQEIVELSPQQIMSTEPTRRQAWERSVKKTLNSYARANSFEEYVLLRGGQLVGASLSVFVKVSMLSRIKNVEGALKKTGMSGMAGNKGAVAIRMEVDNTSVCFVTAHLAAGFANYDERNRDYRTISHGLHFQRNRTIDSHDAIVWLGDFNYRIGLTGEVVRRLAAAGDYATLYENDQLNLQMVNGLAFRFYAEARITFRPTYKFDVDSDVYDSSEKARIPAWCDRILRRGDGLRQLSYGIAPTLRFSDHRPVYATFVATVNVIDEARRDRMSRELYDARKSSVGNPLIGDATDDEDDLLAPHITGLPPASSDKRKWWLDNGMPARSTVQPPSETSRLNPDRPSNPWTPTSQPDWIGGGSSTPRNTPSKPSTHQQPPPPPPRRTSASTIASSDPDHQPPLPQRPSANSDLSKATASLTLDRHPSTASESSKRNSVAVPRKSAPPPIPRKKPTLQSSPSPVSSFTKEGGGPPTPYSTPPLIPSNSSNVGFKGGNVSQVSAQGPFQSPPRRGTGEQQQQQQQQQQQRLPPKPLRPVPAGSSLIDMDDDQAPAKPARRTKSPMDDSDDDDASGNGLSGWVPLQPT